MPPKKLPYLQLFVADYVRDTRVLSPAARAVWMDLLCLMHDAERRGYLTVAGKPAPTEYLARFCGCSAAEIEAAVAEILATGVGSRDDAGVIYSRRMLKDEKAKKAASAYGRQGGNPKLKQFYLTPGFIYAIRRASDGAIKIGASTNPFHRCRKKKGSLRGEDCEVVQTWPVTLMGKAEAALHEVFADRCVEGEWFRLTAADLAAVGPALEEKALLKGTLTDAMQGQGKGPLEIDMELEDGVGVGSESSAAGGGGAGGGDVPAGFAEFWSAYPRHTSKQSAVRAWAKLDPDAELRAAMLAAIERQKRSDQWQGGVIPHASTWLNQARWEDEMPNGKQPGQMGFDGLKAFVAEGDHGN